MKEIGCPNCGSERVVEGRYFNPWAVMQVQAAAPNFLPDGVKKFSVSSPFVHIHHSDVFMACIDCGLLWSWVAPDSLITAVEKTATHKTPHTLGRDRNLDETTTLVCPDCGGQQLVLGKTTTTTPGFRPKGLRWFSFRLSELKPKRGNKFVACMDCGLLWSGIDQAQLTQALITRGNNKTRRKYGLNTGAH